jgi:hypothetical protein
VCGERFKRLDPDLDRGPLTRSTCLECRTSTPEELERRNAAAWYHWNTGTWYHPEKKP